MMLHVVKQRAANHESVIIETRNAVVWRGGVMIDNEAGGGRSQDYIEGG